MRLMQVGHQGLDARPEGLRGVKRRRKCRRVMLPARRTLDLVDLGLDHNGVFFGR